jgi:FkbM family methyltransferase
MTIRTLLDRLVAPRFIAMHGIRVSTGRVDGAGPVPIGVLRALRRGDYEQDECTVLQKTLRPDDRVLEVGAGIGVVTALCCRIAGDGNVAIYEANPGLASRLKHTCTSNGFAPKINIRPVAAESGPVVFRVGDNFLSSSLVDRPNLSREIVMEADSFTAVLAEVQPTFLVMDIEGAETSILASTGDFGAVRAICLEIHPHVTGQDKIEKMMAHLARCGFMLRQELSRKQTVFLEREPEQ